MTALPEPARERVLARCAQVRPPLEDGVALARLARALGVSPRTAGRWVARYRREGLAYLTIGDDEARELLRGVPE